MSALVQQINRLQAQLENHAFCQHLRQTQDISLSAYKFVPRMTFFVLGFRDILEAMRIENPQTEIEKSLNAHCDEDSEHWLWFIKDLERLNMDVDYWGGGLSSVLTSLWSRESYAVRDMVYQIIHYVRTTKTAGKK